VLLGGDIHGAKVKKVGVRVVAIDFEDFRDEPPSRSSLDVDDDVERIGNICLDGSVRLVNRASPCLAELACIVLSVPA